MAHTFELPLGPSAITGGVARCSLCSPATPLARTWLRKPELFQRREGCRREDLVSDAGDDGSTALAVVPNLVPGRVVQECRSPRVPICQRRPLEYVGQTCDMNKAGIEPADCRIRAPLQWLSRTRDTRVSKNGMQSAFLFELSTLVGYRGRSGGEGAPMTMIEAEPESPARTAPHRFAHRELRANQSQEAYIWTSDSSGWGSWVPLWPNT
jgi:hypothetical protein